MDSIEKNWLVAEDRLVCYRPQHGRKWLITAAAWVTIGQAHWQYGPLPKQPLLLSERRLTRTVLCASLSSDFPARDRHAQIFVPFDSDGRSEFGISSPKLKKKNTWENRVSMNYSIFQVSFRAKKISRILSNNQPLTKRLVRSYYTSTKISTLDYNFQTTFKFIKMVLHSVTTVLVFGYSMLHGIREINIAGGRLFLICYCLKMGKRCHVLGLIL